MPNFRYLKTEGNRRCTGYEAAGFHRCRVRGLQGRSLSHRSTELRNKFREAGVEYTVVKNTLTRFAANKAGYNQFDEMLNGTTSLATTTGDPIAPARIVCEFAKKNKNVLKIKGGFVEGSVLSVEQLQGFGELPSKDALIAQVLGTFLAPISALAFCLDQIRQQKKAPLPRKKLPQKPDPSLIYYTN